MRGVTDDCRKGVKHIYIGMTGVAHVEGEEPQLLGT